MRRPSSVLAWVAPTLVVIGCGFDPEGSSGDAGPDGPLDAPTDSDGDGIPDESDNCPSVPNTAQFDEDGDLRGDVCDNCPHVSNSAQTNADGDGVGDSCDPNPSGPNRIELFEGFNGSSLPPGWGPVSVWSVSGGMLRQPSNEVGDRVLGLATGTWDDVVVETSVSIVSISPDTPPRSAVRAVSVLSRYEPDTIYGNGYLCSAFQSVLDLNPASQISTRFLNSGAVTGGDTDSLPGRMSPGDTIRLVATSEGIDQSCRSTTSQPITSSYQDNVLNDGGIALRTFGVAANFRYVVVITPGP